MNFPLAKLNPEQLRAVEYGGPNYGASGPLLIIAGAGSGKTNTLAHRVAHLIVNGADPLRVLLLTFSRRAATEMIRRVERITSQALGQNAGAMTGALTWSGTFHAIGARLLREYAHQIGLSPSFTIHDREDSADLLNLVRHDLGFSNTERRFPAKSTCLSIYSRVVNAESPLEDVVTWHGDPPCRGLPTKHTTMRIRPRRPRKYCTVPGLTPKHRATANEME
jgi:DNA helicase II / ATP-dependent DNA helicase PcrA